MTNEPVPWSATSLLEVLTKGWKSVYEDVVVDMDRRPVQAAIKRLKDSHRNLARSTGPAAAHSIADALKDIALLLGAFPTPSGARDSSASRIMCLQPSASRLGRTPCLPVGNFCAEHCTGKPGMLLLPSLS